MASNTILFAKNNQYIKQGMILGELSTTGKQTRTEIKPVLSTSSGEVYMPRLKKKKNFVNKNKLLWILSGKVYQAPTNSFLNFYTDHKINKNSFIFRTKIINHYPGSVKILNNKPNLFERSLQISANQYTLENSTINRINSNHLVEQYILKSQKNSYLINLNDKLINLIHYKIKNYQLFFD